MAQEPNVFEVTYVLNGDWKRDRSFRTREERDEFIEYILKRDPNYSDIKTRDYYLEPKQRGGRRDGAGRKPGDRSKVVTIRISPEALEILNAQANKSEFIDKLIKESGRFAKYLERVKK